MLLLYRCCPFWKEEHNIQQKCGWCLGKGHISRAVRVVESHVMMTGREVQTSGLTWLDTSRLEEILQRLAVIVLAF